MRILKTRNMECRGCRRILAAVGLGVVWLVCAVELRGVVGDGVAGNVSRAGDGDEGTGGTGGGDLYDENPLLDIVYYDGALGSAWEASIVSLGQSESGEPPVPSLFSPSFESSSEEGVTIFFAFLNVVKN